MRRLQFIVAFASLAPSCVDPVDISLPANDLPMIIEGNIVDNAAPDTIRISKTYPADGNFYKHIGLPGAKLWITDDAGVVDTLLDLFNGVYVTDNLQGAVGRSYKLEGRLPDSTQIESTMERMLPAGSIDTIYYELTSKVNQETSTSEPGIDVFVNSTVDASSSHRMRWKFNGTYVYQTDPSLIQIPIDCPVAPCPTMPLACADGCLCCMCWASEREDIPLVSNPTFLSGTTVNRVFIKYIPINNFTFYEKYRVEVTQMELSADVFDFYSGIRKQIENAASLFQPPFFGLDGNVSMVSGKTKIIGVFSAAAQTTRVRYILQSEIPLRIAEPLYAGDCRAVVDHSTIVVPPFWN